MLFGCSTWSMNKEMERSIDGFNRRMVRHACEIFWPKRTSTKEVNVFIEPVTCEAKKRRWQMLGHVMPMNDHVPANIATIDAIKTKKEKRGRPNTSLLTTIKDDLKRHSLSIEEAIELAKDWKSWKLEESRASANEKLKLLNQHLFFSAL